MARISGDHRKAGEHRSRGGVKWAARNRFDDEPNALRTDDVHALHRRFFWNALAGWHQEFQSYRPDKILLAKIKADKNRCFEFECTRNMEHI